jgi:UPF0176 protein
VKLRKGIQVGNKVFRKGKSEKLKFKHSGVLPEVPLAKAITSIRQQISPKRRLKKTLLGNVNHYYVKAGIGLVEMQNGTLQNGNKIVIVGPTTGEMELTISNMHINGKAGTIAHAGDKVTFAVPSRVRLSDKVYLIVN